MKKILKFKNMVFIVILTVCINLLCGCTSIIKTSATVAGQELLAANSNNKTEDKVRTLNYDEVKDSVIRFHVIANSDSEKDQNLKLKVKDKVIEYLYPYLSQSQSLAESRQIIKNNMDKVKNIAEKVISDNKYDYSVKVQLSRENFPDKTYGNIALPQGNYEAFRIIIGSGQGKNWWCVMFPPLCFVDETKAQVEYDKTEERIEENKDKTSSALEVDSGDSEKEKQEDDTKNNIQIKFKIVEMFKELFK